MPSRRSSPSSPSRPGPRRRVVALAPFALFAAATGCLFGSEPPLEVRTFRPPLSSPETSGVGSEALPLELLPVRSEPSLDERMLWQLSPTEWAYDEQNRWLLSPSLLVEDALEHALFASGRFALARGDAPTRLEILVETFHRTSDAAHVALSVRVTTAAGTVVRHVEATAATATLEPEAYAEAAGTALSSAVAEVVALLGSTDG
jgi:ABC-type uncharacterized transport system auxiliary subunit